MNTVDSKSKPNAASLSSMIDQLDLEELNSYKYIIHGDGQIR